MDVNIYFRLILGGYNQPYTVTPMSGAIPVTDLFNPPDNLVVPINS
jgi:hypothetical protein